MKEVSKIYNGPERNDDISCEHAMKFGIVDCECQDERNKASQVIL